MTTTHYLDHAATSFPKPEPVLAAVLHWFAAVGVSAGRGDGAGCRRAAIEVAAARAGIAALCNTSEPSVAFVSGATEGLNLALRALLRHGDHVITTAFEHSSVVRPLRALQRERAISVEVIEPGPDGGLDAARLVPALAARPTRLVCATHASNVTGVCLDAAALARAARQAGANFLLDASQTVGWLDVDVGADVVVASCHKALAAPPGLGFVAVRDGLRLAPQKQGGTGSSQALDEHPTDWPAAFEAGTPNTPALFGLAAALRALPPGTASARLAAALARCEQLEQLLTDHAPIRLLRPPPGPRVPVTSFVHRDYDPAELGAMLGSAGFHVRSGHHCAPWLHRSLGTDAAGTVRVSPGADTPPATIQALADFLLAL
jgi:selenocysteine lyase/cysteine desulfurase